MFKLVLRNFGNGFLGRRAQKDAAGPVSPFGSVFSEFGLRELRLAPFLTFFDFRFFDGRPRKVFLDGRPESPRGPRDGRGAQN